MSRTPKTNTQVGHDAIEPLMPRPTGTVVPAASGMRRTNPASTRPMNAMNAPIPAAIAALSAAGIALNTAVRKPVSGQHHDDDAVDDDQAHRLGPGDLRRDGHGEQAVDAQTGGDRERIVGDDTEDDAHQAGDQRGDRRDLADRQDVAEDVGLGGRVVGREAAEDQRVEHHDVGHREEGDEAAANLAATASNRVR